MSQPPTILVVFGATGDLMSRKIVPSLAYLSLHGRLPESFSVIGFSRRGWDDGTMRGHVDAILDTYEGQKPLGPDRTAFLDMFMYQRGTFADDAAYASLAERLAGIDAERGTCSNKLFYLAVPPGYYTDILQRLANFGLTKPCSDETGYTRVLVEKPFGRDMQTAQDLDELLGSLFEEKQIYRIDHYLAKELLQGILSFRFSNVLFEPSWDSRLIERIDITLRESIGAEKRGAFYDGVGALRDVGQNHLLQMLALVTMERPPDLSAAAVREARLAALRELRPLVAEEAARHTYRAQYEGFTEIDGVQPDSDTETYFRLETDLRGPRWDGVPVTMESGKRLGPPLKQIAVTFRSSPPCTCFGDGPFNNVVTFQLEPAETITIRFWAKKPGFDSELEPREFAFFLYEKQEKAQYVEEYAKLLLDAIRGDQTLFVSTDEVAAMWRFIDPVVRAWADGAVGLETYEPDSAGVCDRAATALEARAHTHEIGIVGLGKMGGGLAGNLLEGGWRVVGYNRSRAATDALASEGLVPTGSPAELVSALKPPRCVWVMVPAGQPTDDVLFGDGGLTHFLEAGDLVIDGGNSLWSDTVIRAERLSALGIRFLDAGTSGGPAGARHGACIMVGGQWADFEEMRPLWRALAVPGGYAFFEGHGAGHFVKMVHNGIEYGMMQAIAEGFGVLRASGFGLDLSRASDVYNRGSVIESRLIGWLAEAFEVFGSDLAAVPGTVGHTGEGEWTIRAAEELGVEHRVIEAALAFRLDSEDSPSYTGKIVQAMRNRFGGHQK